MIMAWLHVIQEIAKLPIEQKSKISRPRTLTVLLAKSAGWLIEDKKRTEETKNNNSNKAPGHVL